MTGNYDNVAGMEVAEYTSDGEEPTRQRHCRIDEFYFDKYTGELVLTFKDRDTGRYFHTSIPVRANSRWNEFVESLPTWDN